ncbi:hypothetical protein ACFOSC_28035 [Streptantibioticus rubrisoli]|uniref:Uncharacterized protein n=1 Tax=Streptantibioticus rubrisoli TaxID=1387313 RepID=A0ABT1PGI2_9ACTN|nr:hypothetical protein [Streptantibioticus rubrisoli]MCQ4044459.1 hypothetical protein [Streptantibioticus rubrisoli]
MKTTMLMRPIANPRRTTLAHLKDADELIPAPAAEESAAEVRALPQQTANPRRTTLDTLPSA